MVAPRRTFTRFRVPVKEVFPADDLATAVVMVLIRCEELIIIANRLASLSDEKGDHLPEQLFLIRSTITTLVDLGDAITECLSVKAFAEHLAANPDVDKAIRDARSTLIGMKKYLKGVRNGVAAHTDKRYIKSALANAAESEGTLTVGSHLGGFRFDQLAFIATAAMSGGDEVVGGLGNENLKEALENLKIARSAGMALMDPVLATYQGITQRLG